MTPVRSDTRSKRFRAAVTLVAPFVLLIVVFAWQVQRRAHLRLLDRYLCSAVKAQVAAQVARLLAEGADPNSREVPPPTPSGWVDRVKQLIRPPTYDRSSMAVLHRAVYTGNAAIVGHLLRAGADVNARWSGEFWYGNEPPLMMSGETPSIVRMLLDAGADPNAAGEDIVNRHRYPAFYRTISYGNAATVKELLRRGADLRASPGPEWALMEATSNDDAGVMALLLDHDNHPNSQPGGMSLLASAACYGNLSVVKLLIKRGANINARNLRDGTTALGATRNFVKEIGGKGKQAEGASAVIRYLRSLGAR